MKGATEIVEKVIKHLESLGYRYLRKSPSEPSKEVIFLVGEDSRGKHLEFKYYPSDGYILDRDFGSGSQFWDITSKM